MAARDCRRAGCCEILVELAFSTSLAKRGVPELAEPIGEVFTTYNLANTRVRKFYEAITGDTIGQAPFWQRYSEHAKRRHNIVHKGEQANATEAQESIDVAKQFVAHIESELTSS